MSPPAKKRKPTPKPLSTTPISQSTTQSTPVIPSLPSDLLLSCIARVSRLYYPTLSLVSKSLRSLIASPELYKARSLLGHTESCLYVYISSHSHSRWYTLCRKPDEIILNDDTTMKKMNEQNGSSGYALVTVHSSHSPQAGLPGLVVVGSDIYSIASRATSLPSPYPNPVSIFDCRSHSWRPGPSLPVTLDSFSATVVDQKVYLAGCFKDGGSDSLKNLVEVLDTETQRWGPVPIPCSLANGCIWEPATCIDGKLHVVHSLPGTWEKKVVAYDSKEGRWDMVAGLAPETAALMSMGCEIENVLYAVIFREMCWYDTEVSTWRKLKGLVGLPKFPCDLTGIRLADYGGKMAVFWDEGFGFYFLDKRIWCAEISLEKRPNCEIWGKVEWVDHVLTLPPSYEFRMNVVAATL